MIDSIAIHDGKLKAMYLFGEEIGFWWTQMRTL